MLQIKYEQKPGSQVSPDLAFRDDTGKTVRLGDYFGKRPIVLIPGYYSCPMLCSLVMEGVVESFRDLRWNAGEQFEVIFVSIDPREGPSLAAAKKKLYLHDYGREGTENGWHFLVAANSRIEPLNQKNRSSLPTIGGKFPLSQRERAGLSRRSGAKAEVRENLSDADVLPVHGAVRVHGDAPPPHDANIQTLADEIGFRFAYDAGLKQFAHPSGFVVLTPDGKVAHYFFGVTFSAKEVDAALRVASARKTDSPVREFILLCCQYSPLRGKYGNMIMDTVRASGMGMVVMLGVYFIRPVRRKSSG